jgi:hypothetical protein
MLGKPFPDLAIMIRFAAEEQCRPEFTALVHILRLFVTLQRVKLANFLEHQGNRNSETALLTRLAQIN